MPTTRHTTRRHFLQGVAAAGSASIALSPVHRALGYQSPNDRPVFATIGLRNQGWAITNKTFRFADFAAMADLDSRVLETNIAKAEKRQGKKPDAYKDYRKILDRKDIDAVMIATPDHWHTKVAIEAMHAGKDVYCEKPLTLTINEGKLIEKAVKETGRVFQVGTMQRTESGRRFLQAIALVKAGRIGTVKKITCGINGMAASPAIPIAPVPKELDWDFWLGPAPKVAYRALPEIRKGYGGGHPLYSNAHYSFRNWHEYSGGKLTDWGAHHVDIATWGLDKTTTGPVSVAPVMVKHPVPFENGRPTDPSRYNTATAFLIKALFADGQEIEIRHDGRNGILFEGTRGRIFVNRGSITGKPVDELKSNPLPSGALQEAYKNRSLTNHFRNFFEATVARKEPISDVFSHHRGLTTCHLAGIAARLGRKIGWDPKAEKIVGDPQAQAMVGREVRKGFETQV